MSDTKPHCQRPANRNVVVTPSGGTINFVRCRRLMVSGTNVTDRPPLSN